MTTHTPLISVIVPVYNQEAYVAACISSLRAQTMDDVEKEPLTALACTVEGDACRHDDVDMGMRACFAIQCGQILRVHNIVGVDEADPCAARHAEAGIARHGHALVGLFDDGASGIARNRAPSAVLSQRVRGDG